MVGNSISNGGICDSGDYKLGLDLVIRGAVRE